jgi:hypothetical protein
VIILFATVVPAMAQDEFPRMQMGFGYANLTLPAVTGADSFGNRAEIIGSGHHSGFTSQLNFNFTKNVGFDYYLGYYGLGDGFELLTNIFGGKLQIPTEKATPYLVAGIGRGNFMFNQGGQTFGLGGGAATRLGGGIDYKLSDSFYWRTEVTRLQVHVMNSWLGKANIATGVVFTVLQ